jgi:FtsP/CotA-like multicopper oxidase with cupredoxin domain
MDSFGNRLFCFMNQDGTQSPTLHVNPGDMLIVNLKNNVPSSRPGGMSGMSGIVVSGSSQPAVCGAITMSDASVNVHYHGTNTPPTCHQDEVIRTLINTGQSFTYALQIPPDEPSGLYWYHPHVHGISDNAVHGGATGAIIVEGIQNTNPIVTGLPVQVLMIRDNLVPKVNQIGDNIPFFDVSLNYIPIPYPNYPPAVLKMNPGQKQFWRVANTSADEIVDLQVLYDGVPQPLTVVALDGVATNSQDGTTKGTAIVETDILLPTASRAEFIVSPPASTVKVAQLVSLTVDTGPAGDNTPGRPFANIQLTNNAIPLAMIPAVSGTPTPARFGGLASIVPNTTRSLYLDEKTFIDVKNPFVEAFTEFFITVDGQQEVLFNPNNPPAIITQQGAVEDWTIANHTMETHMFHMHQIHFLVLAINGVAVPDGQYLDTIQVPYWTGTGPYPSVTLRMDFRGATVGDFVYHCHILAHEDGGMMATIRVTQ